MRSRDTARIGIQSPQTVLEFIPRTAKNGFDAQFWGLFLRKAAYKTWNLACFHLA